MNGGWWMVNGVYKFATGNLAIQTLSSKNQNTVEIPCIRLCRGFLLCLLSTIYQFIKDCCEDSHN
jgi:hypothetical protein